MKEFIDHQFTAWPALQKQHEALSDQADYSLRTPCGYVFEVHFRPGRIKSSTGGYQKTEQKGSPLLDQHLLPHQKAYPLVDGYDFLVNPYPIFWGHGIVRASKMQPQKLSAHIGRIASMAKVLGQEHTLLYNGAKCGASIPEHFHLHVLRSSLFEAGLAQEFAYEAAAAHILRLEESQLNTQGLQQALSEHHEDFINAAFFVKEERVIAYIFKRKAHRHRYFPTHPEAEGLLISPGVVDILGRISIVRPQDLHQLNAQKLQHLLTDLF